MDTNELNLIEQLRAMGLLTVVGVGMTNQEALDSLKAEMPE
jgi:hypothetical protein